MRAAFWRDSLQGRGEGRDAFDADALSGPGVMACCREAHEGGTGAALLFLLHSASPPEEGTFQTTGLPSRAIDGSRAPGGWGASLSVAGRHRTELRDQLCTQSPARRSCRFLCTGMDQGSALSLVEARALSNSEATSLSTLGSAELDRKRHPITDFREMCQQQFLSLEVCCHCSQACR